MPKLLKTNFKDDDEFNLQEEIKKLEDSDRRDLNIIAFYFDETKPDLRNKAQFNIAIGRNIRAAQKLMVFADDQLVKALETAKRDYPEYWVLETLLKVLTK